MNGTDFRNEYKNSMEELTPSSELLKFLSQHMEEAAAEPIQPPLQSKGFFLRHRAILTAAATLVMVIGICAVGAVVLSHFNNMNDMTSGDAAIDGAGAVSIADADAAEEIAYPANDEGKNNAGDAANYEPVAPTATEEVAENEYNNISGGSVSPDGHYSDNSMPASGGTTLADEYSDSMLKELSEKAKNGTLTIEDLGKNITVQGNDAYCQVFRSFTRGSTSYTLVADFKETEDELKVTSLYITETEQNSVYGKIDLINNPDFLEEYFAGRFSEKID